MRSLPSYEGYKFFEFQHLVGGEEPVVYRYQEGDEILTSYTVTAEDCSQATILTLRINSEGFEMPTLTSSMVTIAGYVPTSTGATSGSQTCQMRKDSTGNYNTLTITLVMTAQAYTAGTGNQLTVTINDGVHAATTIEITFAVASNQLKQNAIVKG